MALVKPTQSRTRSRPTGAVKAAGLNSKEWVPCETRHTFVSIMSDSGVSDEQIADLVGHAKTSPTRTVYRHRLRSVITKGAERSKPLSAAAGRGSVDQGPSESAGGPLLVSMRPVTRHIGRE